MTLLRILLIAITIAAIIVIVINNRSAMKRIRGCGAAEPAEINRILVAIGVVIVCIVAFCWTFIK